MKADRPWADRDVLSALIYGTRGLHYRLSDPQRELGRFFVGAVWVFGPRDAGWASDEAFYFWAPESVPWESAPS